VSVHKFRPRYRALALSAIGVGGPIAALGAIAAVTIPIVAGGLGVLVGAAYLLSPAWKLEVAVDDDGLEVRSPGKQRFKLAWRDVARVVASESTHTCYVDGGSPEKSLIVPGVGAPAPYDLTDKVVLYDTIVAHVPADKIQRVERLELANKPA
jgi:hypothetical protein